MSDAPPPAFDPAPRDVARCQWLAFAEALSLETGEPLTAPAALQAWSVAHWRGFWAFFLDWCRTSLAIEGEAEPVCLGDTCEHARFFPGLRLNYAASLLDPRIAPDAAIALIACHPDAAPQQLTRGQLRARVARLAAALRAQGIVPGDRIAAILRNDAQAAVVALAAAAVGATLSTSSPDMGPDAIADRFGPLAPRLLFAHCASRSFDAAQPLAERVAEVARRLPALQLLVRIDGESLPALDTAQSSLDDFSAAAADEPFFGWPRFPFDHPLFILFSSGTTGRPKCIVHGAGGSLLEHVKEHRLHCDLGPGDRLYFHTGCSWMMWNWQLSALASGATLVTYDGPLDTEDRLWRLVAAQRVTVFGTSPAYLRLCESAGLAPSRDHDLGALRAILSTGAVLHDASFDWVRRAVGQLPLHSISGGTDILGCFVLGSPLLPVHAGESACRSLGLDVQAWQDGAPVPGVGHLVCANPFPSRPLGFFGDADGSAFHAAYFSQNPGVWTHGDLIEFTASGGARLHGRSDGVLNVRGIKVAPAEILGVLEAQPGVAAALVVQRPPPAGEPGAEPAVVALLVPAPGATLDGRRIAGLRAALARRLSAAHVPDLFLAVPELPQTHSGKLSEAAARCALQGLPAPNASALRNPQCLDAIRDHPGLRGAGEGAAGAGQGADLLPALCALWARHLGISPVAPDDNFFDLGGNSLMAAAILARVRRMTGRRLPLAALWQAPTARALAALLEEPEARVASRTLAPMRPGQGAPLFLVHGLSGTVMECWPLVRALGGARPVVGVQAHGLDGEQPPLACVERMAERYVAAVRAHQPHGPYALCGFSFGALVALEMARRLTEAGEAVAPLCLVDPFVHQPLARPLRAWQRARRVALTLAHLPRGRRAGYLAGCIARLAREPGAATAGEGMKRPPQWECLPPAQRAVYEAMLRALAAYQPRPYRGGPLLLVQARIPLEGYFDCTALWRRVAAAGMARVVVPGTHLELVAAQAARTAQAIDEAFTAQAAAAAPAARARGLRWLRPAGGSR